MGVCDKIYLEADISNQYPCLKKDNTAQLYPMLGRIFQVYFREALDIQISKKAHQALHVGKILLENANVAGFPQYKMILRSEK